LKEAAKEVDRFEELGVSKGDKMSYQLLKWVFNSIHRPSEPDDKKLLGANYVLKRELAAKMQNNPQLLKALGYQSQIETAKAIEAATCRKEGCLTWEEFLQFFFFRQAELAGKPKTQWWLKLEERAEIENKDITKAAGGQSKFKADIPDEAREIVPVTEPMEVL